MAVIEAFLKTEMGEGCRLVDAGRIPRRAPAGWAGPICMGALISPHELRVESRTAIPALAAWLEEAQGVVFFRETVVFEHHAAATSAPPGV